MSGITYTIDFAAAVARLEAGTAQASRSVKKMADEMESASAFARNALASIGVGLSGAAFAAAVKSAADAADAAAKMGDRFGIATEQMIGMQHAANLAGVSNDGLTIALKGLAKSAVEAELGNEKARTAFERLHIQANEFLKLPMAQQLSLVVDRLGGLENAAVRNATAQALMGKQAGQMMGLVAEGSGAIVKATQDTIAWGLSLNRVDAAKIELANDALKRAEAATKGVFTQISLALSPAVIALANHFADTKAQAQGYRKEISEGSEGVILAIGLAANVVTGLQFAWIAAKLAVAEAYNAMAQGAAMFSDKGSDVVRTLALLPGPIGMAFKAFKMLGIEGPENLKLFAESTAATVDNIKAELDSLVSAGLPFDEVVARIRKVQATIDEEAKKVAKRRQELNKEGADPGIVPFDHYKAGLAQQLGALIDHNRDALTVVQQHYERQQALLDESVAKGIITDDFWQGQSMLLFAQFQTERTKILDEELKKRYGISQVYHQLDLVSSSAFFGAMGAMMSSHNRAAFEIGKAAAISQTIIDTYRAAQGAFAAFASIPYVGPALGAAAAAAAVVAGIARVQQIRSTSFGGGSVSGGASPTFSANPVTGVPSAPVSPVAAPATSGSGQSPTQITVNVITNGNIVSAEGFNDLVRDYLAPALRDIIGESDVIIIDPNSRQAAQLVGAA